MNHFSFRLGFLLIGLQWVAGSVEVRAQAALPPQVEAAITQLATYELGQDRTPLTTLSSYISSIASSAGQQKRLESRLLRFIQSGATPAGRSYAAKQLGRVATESSVATLAQLLLQPETSEIARQILENIKGPAADNALREALSTASGSLKIGIIDSIGRRRDTGAVGSLAPLLADPDADLAAAAIGVLGQLGTLEAVQALLDARSRTADAPHDALNDALLQSADALIGTDHRSTALKIYLEVFQSRDPGFIRAAALRSLVQAQPEEAKATLERALQSDDEDVRSAAIGLTAEYPPVEMTALLGQALPQAPAIARVQILSALGQRGDKSALPILIAATRDNDARVRSIALEQLSAVGDASIVPMLTAVAATRSSQERISARASLYRLRGEGVNPAIVDQLNHLDPSVRCESVRAINERAVTNATAALLHATGDPEPTVRTQALKALADLAGPSELPGLLDLLARQSATSEAEQIEKTLVAVLRRSDPRNLERVVSAAQRTTDPAVRCSLLAVLATGNHPLAFVELKRSLQDKHLEVRRAAVRALADWADSSPWESLIKAAEVDVDPVNRILAVRGCARLIGLKSDRPPEESVRLLAQTMQLAERPEEKRTILAMLPRFAGPEARQLAETCLNDPSLAEAAQLSIAAMK